MTAITSLKPTLCLPVGMDKQTPELTLRAGTLEDVTRLAELFTITYGQTTHPCQAPDYIDQAMRSGQQRWFVVELGAKIVGCSCVARRAWNQSWEVCHGVVHPEARRTGVISSLIRLSLEEHCPQALELGFYITRNLASHSVMKHIKPAVLVGHDGGPDTVDGLREYHLTALHPPTCDGFVHAAPWYANTAGAEFISHFLYESLQLEPVQDNYPATCLSGPPGAEQTGHLRYTHDAAGNALTLSGESQCALTEQAVIAELSALLEQWKHAEYISVPILADKLELLSYLISLGFSITAYLPAWHLHQGARFDCILLVLNNFSPAPRSHGFDDEVVFFDQAYARLADHLCTLAAQRPL